MQAVPVVVVKALPFKEADLLILKLGNWEIGKLGNFASICNFL